MRLVGSRLAGALGLLVVLIVIQQLAPDLFPLFVAAALIGLPILQWATVYFFGRRAAENPQILALQIRTQDAVALAIASSVGAVLGLLVVLRALALIPIVDRAVFLIGVSFVLLMVAAPAVNWLIVWRPWAPVREGRE